MSARCPGCSLTRGLDVKASLDAPAGFTALSATGGRAASLAWDTPAGPSIVVVATVLFAVGLAVVRGRVGRGVADGAARRSVGYAKMPVMTPNANAPNVMLVTPMKAYLMSEVATRATMTLVMTGSIGARTHTKALPCNPALLH